MTISTTTDYAKDSEIEFLRESISNIILQIDDIGWKPLGDVYTDGDRGITLTELQRISKIYREFIAANPIVAKAINLRTAYTWGQGVDFHSPNKNKLRRVMRLSRKAFADIRAQIKIERSLADCGNVFILTDIRTGGSTLIPLAQISEVITDKEDGSTIAYYRRTHRVKRTNTNTGVLEDKEVSVYYPTTDPSSTVGDDKFSSIRAQDQKTYTVDRTKVITHIKSNEQDGWLFGVPDMLSAAFWVKAYTRSQEANLTLTEALARFAWKVTNPHAKGNIKNTATKTASSPNGVAGTAIMDGGNDLQAINRAGANVDFGVSWPIAAIVAAGFGIPLDDLLYQKGAVNQDGTVPDSLVATITMRQNIWITALEDIFDTCGVEVEVVFPRMFAEPVHRVLQGISVAANTGTLHPEEVREAVILQMKRYGVRDFEKSLPKPGEWAAFAKGGTNNPGTPPLNTPDNSGTADKRTPGGALADGDNEMIPSN